MDEVVNIKRNRLIIDDVCNLLLSDGYDGILSQLDGMFTYEMIIFKPNDVLIKIQHHTTQIHMIYDNLTNYEYIGKYIHNLLNYHQK